MSFVIKREEWARGKEGGQLYNTCNGKYCALGFYLKHLGIPDAAMAGKPAPCEIDDIDNILPASDDWLLFNTTLIDEIVEANDCDLFTDETEFKREGAIRDAFADQGINAEFEG